MDAEQHKFWWLESKFMERDVEYGDWIMAAVIACAVLSFDYVSSLNV